MNIPEVALFIAEQNGITREILYKRLTLLNFSLERAITQPVNKNDPTQWHEYSGTAFRHGVNYNTYYRRVTKQGMTPYDAATTKIRRNTK